MTTYTVNISTVAEIAGEMGQISSNIQGILSHLDDGTAQNLAEWTSSARDAYNAAKAKWDVAAQDMVAQSANAQNSLAAIGDNYQQAEQSGAALWG
ncbi:MAG TPA: WXG100 family type VII secretion target [Trebonia sp.]